ncbi:TFIIS N-terminal domain-containing protein [Plasmodiophora brassicae]
MASAALVQAGERLRVLASSDSSAQDASAIHAVLVELERYPMSKKTLHETRIGAIVNSARKRIAAPQLQRIAKRVIASWRSVVQDTTTPAASNSPVPAMSAVQRRPAGRVPSLESLCVGFVRREIMRLGEIPRAFPTSLLLQFVANAKADDLIRIERLNPHLVSELDGSWERIVRLDIPDRYRAEHAKLGSHQTPPGFWRQVYVTVMNEREARQQQYIKSLEQRQAKTAVEKQQTSIKRLPAASSAVRKAEKRQRTSASSSAANPARSRLEKIVGPVRKRLEMEKKFVRGRRR